MMRRIPQRTIGTVTTNVPGPPFPLYCLGREMLEYRPFVPIAHGVRVGVAILSYNGRLFFGVTGDANTAPDVDVLAQGIVAEVDALLASITADAGESEVGRKGTTKKRAPARTKSGRGQSTTANVARRASRPE